LTVAEAVAVPPLASFKFIVIVAVPLREVDVKTVDALYRTVPVPLAGFVCNGEIGPVGARSYLHGYTASVALLVEL